MSWQNPAGVSLLCARVRRFNAFLIATLLFGLCFLLSSLSSPLFAQVNTGRILGTVTDQSGGVIAGAMVTVTNTATGVARTLTADQSGEYVAPNLALGTYSVRATAMGFQTFERQNITVGVGQDSRIDAQLTPGQVTQTVEVTAAAADLDTTSAVVSGTLETKTILDLPMNGRNFQNLLVLRPGVVAAPGGGTLTTSTNGLQPQDNNYFFEGLDSNDPFSGQSITNTTLPFGDAGTILPIDAIQELNVETNAPAEFGRRPGAVINVALKSGANAIHGSAYAFGRDGSWDAKDYSFTPGPKQPVELEQWGGSIGGPILKNKIFYFGTFERQSYSVGNTFGETVPTLNPSVADPNVGLVAAINGLNALCPGASFCGKGSGTIAGVSAVNVNPLSANLLPQYGVNNGTTGALANGFPDVIAVDNGVGKIEYQVNDHHAITGSYFYGTGNAVGEDSIRTSAASRQQGLLTAEFLTASWTWTPNSTWVNDLRGGWNRYLRVVNVADFQTPPTAYGLNTGITNPVLFGLPTIKVTPFSQLGGDSNSPKAFGPGDDYDLVDHVSYLRGKHAFKFGGEVLTSYAYDAQYADGRGVFNFTGATVNGTTLTGLESFLAGIADPKKGAQLLEGTAARTFTQSDFSGFLEDSWRATQRLTVNAGVRYEYFTPLSEIHNLIGSFSTQTGFEQDGVNGVNHPYNPDYKDISPRLGVAWDVTGKGKTVVRAGFGIYYNEIIPLQLVGDTTLTGGDAGISSIPTAFGTYQANGVLRPALNPTNGIGSAAVNIPNANLNWTLNGAQPILPASALGAGVGGSACGTGVAPVNPPPGVSTAKEPAPCSVLFTSANLPSPRVMSWNLGIQHALTPALTVEADYIGNRATDLPLITDLNQINPNSAAEIACNHCESITDLPFYNQFPYLQYINQLADTGISNYEAFQATLTARNYHNLSFIAGYTYSHALTDLSGGDFHVLTPQNSLNPVGDYGASQFDMRHHFSLTPTYNVPGIKSPGQLLQGWVLSSAVVLESGQPWSPTSTSVDYSRTAEFQDRWDFFGNPNDFRAGPTPIPFFPGTVTVGGSTVFNPAIPAACITQATAIGTYSAANPLAGSLAANGCYIHGGSVLIAPAPGQFGTAARNLFYGPRLMDWDFSVFKNWTIKERFTAQFRAEFFNVLNHKILANPGGPLGAGDPASPTFFGCGCSTPDQASTNPVLGTGGAREIQLGLKILF
jgi:hypothetical protein